MKPQTDRRGLPPDLAFFLILLALVNFAVAQPLYDLIGRYPEFLVVQRAGPKEIGLVILILSFAVAPVLFLLQAGLGWLWPAGRRVVRLLLMAGLICLFLLPIVVGFLGVAGAVLAGVAGLALAIATERLKVLRWFFLALSPSALVFPLYLVFLTPVSHLVFPRIPDAHDVKITNPAPVVLIIFDEMNTTALVDQDRRIDALRYPHLAALAHDGIWYPNATTVSGGTSRAVSAILTGLAPADRAPSAVTLPDNLFTWLGGSYALNVSEPITQLCPVTLCPLDGGAGDGGLRRLLSDLAVVYLHVVLPPSLANRYLPSLSMGWKDFAAPVDMTDQFDRRNKESVVQGRRRQFMRFLEEIDPGQGPSLNVIHIILPHMPLEYLPSGKTYQGFSLGAFDEDGVWGPDEALIKLHWQRHLLQVGFVDTLLGLVIERLKQIGLYESALVIVTADHGVSFMSGQRRRKTTEVTYPDILQVPLLVKLPGPARGDMSDRRATSIDIVPTIAEVLGADLPWPVDGVSLLAAEFPARPTLIYGSQAREFDAATATGFAMLERQLEAFGAASPSNQLVVKGPHHDEHVGQALDDVEIGDVKDIAVWISPYFSLESFEETGSDDQHSPGPLVGALVPSSAARAHYDLAIAVNGTVRMTTRTFQRPESPYFFAVMVPEGLLKPAGNLVEVYLIEGPDRLGRPVMR